MLTTLLITLALQAAAPDLRQAALADGRCQYTEQVLARSKETSLIECNTVTVSRSGRIVTVELGSRSWGPAIRLRGRLDGNRLRIERAALRQGRFVEAAGTCELFSDEGVLGRVSCLARIRGQYYAADFVRSQV